MAAPYAAMHSRHLSRPVVPLAHSLGRCPSALAVLATIAIIVAGCDSATTSSVTTGPTPTKCQLTVTPPSNIVADGGTGAVAVSAQPECAWTVATQANWISDLSRSSGQGNGKVEFRAAANPVPVTREGEIVINDSRVRVTQEAAPCRFTIDPDRQTVTNDAADVSVTVTTFNTCTWTARSNVSWITITGSDSGTGNGTVAFRVASNSGATRTGTLTIADRTHTVIQQQASQPAPPPPPPAPVCTYAISPTSQSIAAGGGPINPVTVTTTSACAWTAVSNAPWITVTSGASGLGNGSVGITFAANTGAARSGTLTIAGQTFTATQLAPAPLPCTYTLNPGSASFTSLGGTGSITVTAPTGCAWTAANSASWISFTSNNSGSGNGSVGFLVLPNPGAARSDTISIAGQSFTVSQNAVGTIVAGQTPSVTK